METWEKLQLRRMAVTARLAEIASGGERAPERGKRPRYVERQRTVLKPIDRTLLPFMAPRAPDPASLHAASAAPSSSEPRSSVSDAGAEAKEAKMRRVDCAPMPTVAATSKAKSKPHARLQV